MTRSPGARSAARRRAGGAIWYGTLGCPNNRGRTATRGAAAVSSSQSKRRWRRVNGAELYFETVGQGAPMLVMHGLGLDHTYLRPWHDGLASQARLIYYDHRWNGRSTHAGPADHATWH